MMALSCCRVDSPPSRRYGKQKMNSSINQEELDVLSKRGSNARWREGAVWGEEREKAIWSDSAFTSSRHGMQCVNGQRWRRSTSKITTAMAVILVYFLPVKLMCPGWPKYMVTNRVRYRWSHAAARQDEGTHTDSPSRICYPPIETLPTPPRPLPPDDINGEKCSHYRKKKQ